MKNTKLGICPHIALLPCIPGKSELLALRKGLRKQRIPKITPGWHGEHEQLGSFRICSDLRRGGLLVDWSIVGRPIKTCSLDALCNNPECEKDRLKFGWMVANMALLDMEHELERARDIPHPVYCMREMSRIERCYGKLEKRWRHWAIVPAGYMLYPR